MTKDTIAKLKRLITDESILNDVIETDHVYTDTMTRFNEQRAELAQEVQKAFFTLLNATYFEYKTFRPKIKHESSMLSYEIKSQYVSEMLIFLSIHPGLRGQRGENSTIFYQPEREWGVAIDIDDGDILVHIHDPEQHLPAIIQYMEKCGGSWDLPTDGLDREKQKTINKLNRQIQELNRQLEALK